MPVRFDPQAGGLSARELEVLDLVSRPGGSRKAAACALGISMRTVARHLEVIYFKLGVTNVAAAARLLGRTESDVAQSDR